jgi:HD-GYP domain-containing protein (c-di-GMP phosphodiesterase class II)
MSDPLPSKPREPESDDIQELGREMARAFLLALRSIRTHGDHNQISIAAVHSLVKVLNRVVLECGSLELRAVEDFLYLGDQRLRPQRSDARLIENLIGELLRRGIGGVSLHCSVDDAETLGFLHVLQERPDGGEAELGRLQTALQAAEVPFLVDGISEIGTGMVGEDAPLDPSPLVSAHFQIISGAGGGGGGGFGVGDGGEESGSGAGGPGMEGTGSGGEGSVAMGGPPQEGGDPEKVSALPSSNRRPFVGIPGLSGSPREGTVAPSTSAIGGPRSRCRRAFFTALAVNHAIHHGVQAGENLEIRHAKRTVQNLVDQVIEDEYAVLGLTALKNQDNYSFFHSVNVCVLSVGLGKRVGLTRPQLLDVGTAALFHDIGKTRIPLSILNKPGKLTSEERTLIERHPHVGVREFLRMSGLTSQLFPAMIGCFEHHMFADGSTGSYPALETPYRPHLFGRIVSIADCFDALVTKRVYMESQRTRDQALAFLMSQSGTKFDPILLKLFVSQVGVYPVGTVVRLKSGMVGVVIRGAEEPERCHRPIVTIIDPLTGEPGSTVMNLSRRADDGTWPDEIVEVLEADDAGIDLMKVFA